MNLLPSAIRAVVTSEDDFGHEIRVGHTIQSCPDIQVQHGGTYTDPVTTKPRQFDYRCYFQKQTTRLLLAVECKNLSPAVPLVVCGIRRRMNEAFHDLIESRNGTVIRGGNTILGSSSVTKRAKSENSIYSPGDFVGKSLLRIQTDKTPMVRTPDSDIYDKWAQALSSAVGLAWVACSSAKDYSVSRFLTAVIPVVVLPDNMLWRVLYDDNGSVLGDPEQVEECGLFVAREIDVGGTKGTALFHRFIFSHVHFFTLGGFRSFLSKMAVNDHAWTKLFTTKADEV